ncbi:TIGR02757 family protein [Ancylomarina sp. 16SWW S1-10-2]|uniref:TIGR02757 family protein n=1 Tax=Ancylomarina sp. 16SWW S1-10-2 TaxID=2499681 RepID=UPI001DAD5E29|nr:TIGR02757 family protein [Ancylomarina sp. 16SWW S1-10-2]
MKLSNSELRSFLDEKYDLYNRETFIETDPIQIPKAFSKKEDIEIAAFLASTIAWGQRPTIIRNARKLMQWMDEAPYDFIMNAQSSDLDIFDEFKHRTFNGEDAVFFIQALQNIYKNHGGLEAVFSKGKKNDGDAKDAIANFRETFFSIDHPQRTEKHVSNVLKKSSAKRMNMFLRWMVRNDKRSVDFGIWKNLSPADLYLPLDVHTGRVGRKLGLLERKQNDWAAVNEITNSLRKLDPNDPVKYDFALFGLGIFEKF